MNEASEHPEPSVVPPSPPPYTRKFSVVQRLYGCLRRPSETMKDIGLAPDYTGVAIIIILEFALAVVVFSMVMSKFYITGSYATKVTAKVSLIVFIDIIFGAFLGLLRWAVKSAIVWKACDSGSRWGFSNAAAVTGYAYVVSVVVGIICAVPLSFYLPALYLDVDNIEAATQAIQGYQSQVRLLYLCRLPITFLTVIWKSYLGGIGTHYGTREMCSKTTGIQVFFILGLIGLVIDAFGVLV